MKKKTITNISQWLNYLSAFWCFTVGLSLVFFSPWLFRINLDTSLDFVPFKLIGIMSTFIGIGYVWSSKDLERYNISF